MQTCPMTISGKKVSSTTAPAWSPPAVSIRIDSRTVTAEKCLRERTSKRGSRNSGTVVMRERG